MDRYDILAAMVSESLREMLETAQYCLDYRKVGPQWTHSQQGGCLGVAGAQLLLCIADTMGSYLRRRKNCLPIASVVIDGEECPITEVNQHLRVLNSEYYGLCLSRSDIEDLYEVFRCRLVHNSAIPASCAIALGDPSGPVVHATPRGKTLNLNSLLIASSKAIDRFCSDLPAILTDSPAAKNLVADFESRPQGAQITAVADAPDAFSVPTTGGTRFFLGETLQGSTPPAQESPA